MIDKSSKILQYCLYALLGISALFGILFYTNVVSDDLILYWGYILVIFTAIITIVAPIVYIIFNLKSAVKFIITLGAILVLIVISYALAGNEFSPFQLEKMKTTAEASRMVGAGLILTYILGALTVLSIIYASISRIFK
ncbi:MAG: hypothetical protein IMY70_05930 [Bacteroidetes bacterium]|nr:hypothetical protein [Bacteroidota bacterium]